MNSAIFHQHIFPIRHKLYRFALRLTGNVQEAEDVVQEVLERVWKTPAERSGAIQNWEAWCMTVTRNRSLDKNRLRAQRRTAPLESNPERPAAGADPAQSAEAQDLAVMIRGLLEALPEKQRSVMHLRDIEELSYEEIAGLLDISLDQVKVNLHRARKAIRQKMLLADAAPLNSQKI